MSSLEDRIRRARGLHDVKQLVRRVGEDTSGLIGMTGEPRGPDGLPSSVVRAGGELLSLSFWLHVRTLVREEGERTPSIQPAEISFVLCTPGYPDEHRPPLALVFTTSPLFLPAIRLDSRMPREARAAVLGHLDPHILGSGRVQGGMACLVSDKDWNPDTVDLWDLTRASLRACLCVPESLNWRRDAMNAEALDYVLEHPEIPRQLGDQHLSTVVEAPEPLRTPAPDENEWVLEDWP